MIKKIENIFREFGYEGEIVFSVLCFLYVRKLKFDNLSKDTKKIIYNGKKIYSKISINKNQKNLIEKFISNDNYGVKIPELYQHFLNKRFRDTTGKFFTPAELARIMVEIIPKKQNLKIMDPTCGCGTFLIEASKKFSKNNLDFIGNDIDQNLISIVEIVFLVNKKENHNLELLTSNIYSPNKQIKNYFGKIDFIIANPPFSLKIENFTNNSEIYKLGYKKSDTLFLDLAFKLLKSNGSLICLLPHSIISNTEYKKFRMFIEKIWNIRGIISLPEGVFNETSGTTTKADLIIMSRVNNKTKNKKILLSNLHSLKMNKLLNKNLKKIFTK
ncbi:MAG: N-6 DNA methylase [Pseudomonadota bacterium]|nr:N-6 DNA methylase [Pseudomonadota bacterium]